jgi:two-component system NarL family sensor kinase
MIKRLTFPLYCCAFLVLIFMCPVKAQRLDRDSLLKTMSQAREDTNKVTLYNSIGEWYEQQQSDSAIYYYEKARELSETLGYTRGLIRYLLNRQYLLCIQGQFDSARAMCNRASELSKKIGDKSLLASALGNTGNVYLYTGDKQKAIEFYLQSVALLENLPDNSRRLTNLYSNICVLYQRLEQYDNSILYGEKAIALARKFNYRSELGSALNNMAATFIGMNDPSKARPYLKEALTIAREVNNKELRLSILINMSTLSEKPDPKYYQIYNKAHLDEALQLAHELDHKTGLAISLRCMGDYYFHEKQFAKAKEYALQSLQITRQFKNPEDEKKVLSLLSHLSAATLDFKAYENYYWQSDSVAASLVNEDLAKSIKDLELKYETEKKENQISQLRRERELQGVAIRQKNWLNIALVVLIAAILVTGVLLYRNYRQRQQLQQQTIRELQTEKQLSATDAVLKGQEVERARLAKDLHDGLGGMLSGVKFTFDAVKENIIMTPDNQHAFSRGMDMLETSIRELRRVAHNMMPESLVKTGLSQAVKDFCADLQRSDIQVIYQEYGLDTVNFSNTVSITVYRIIQELLSNTIKHAQATTVIVQLSCHDNRLQLTVEDNGKGLAKEEMNQSTGMGWSNIQSRVDYLKGTVDVQSSPGKGTSVTITLPVQE